MGRWKDKDKEDDETDFVFKYEDNINPLCRLCAERVDTSMTERKDIICMKEVQPEEVLDNGERMKGTKYKCKFFNPISDVV